LSRLEVDAAAGPLEAPDECRSVAFGVQFASPFELHGLTPIENDRADGAPTRLRVVSQEELRAASADEGERTVERRLASGRVALTIDRHKDWGYRLWWMRAGHYLVQPDGLEVLCALPRVGVGRWQRYLVAQVLPLASALRGFEIIHGSAVSFGDQAVAFVAPSGMGKTTLAAHLVLAGASFLTDDALALEIRADEVWAHSGAGIVNVDASDERLLAQESVRRLGRVVGRSDKAHVAVALERRALPLKAVYFLERGANVPTPRVETVWPPDPRLLLASAFLSHLDSAERLQNQLRVCAALSFTAAMHRLRAPATTGADELAELVSRHVSLSVGEPAA